MHKLMLLFQPTEDPLELDRQWSERFVAAAERMPGLRRVTVSRVTEVVSGALPLHLLHELYFDDSEALYQALGSPQGQEAGRMLMSFAAGAVTLCLAEHHEMALSAD